MEAEVTTSVSVDNSCDCVYYKTWEILSSEVIGSEIK